MAEESEKIEGWGVFDRLKNLPHLMTTEGGVVKAPCKLSLQSEIDDEASDAPEFLSPREHQADPIILENDLNEGGEQPEEDNESALSSRELLNQLQAVAVGVRDFKPKTERVVRPKRSTSGNSTKKETAAAPKKSSSSKATSKAILIAASRVRHGVIVKESKERENLAFSDAYLEKTFGLSKTARIEKPKSPAAKERLKAKIKERIPLSTEGLVKKEVGARQRESSGWESEDKLPSRKKAKVAVKGAVKFRLRVLPHERLLLPEAALAEVMAAKEERDIAKTEMAKLLDEIRATENDNFDDLPSDVTERWMAAHAKKLRNSFNFHTTVARHTLASVAPKVGP